MSLSNLGNSIGKAKVIQNIFSDISGSSDDLLTFVKGSEKIRDIFNNMDADDAVKSFRAIGIGGDDLLKILNECGIHSEVLEASIKKAGKTGTPIITKLKDGFKGFAGTLGLTSKALLGWIGGITAVVTAFTLWKNHIEETKQHLLECVSAADEAAESWNKQQETLSGQVSRLEEIQEQLENGNLTEEESYAIKSELYSIQQNLVTTYGDYASAIDLVNGKLDTEIQKVKELTAAEAQRQWNENYEGIQESIKQMETEKSYSLGKIRSHQLLGDDAKAIQRVLEKYEDVVREIPNGDYSAYEFSFVGTPDEAQDRLNEILTDLQAEAKSFEDSKIFDSFIKGASQQLGVAKNLQETYKDTYEWQKQLVLLKDTESYNYGDKSKTAVNWLSDLESAVNDYNTALASGDTDKISEAADKFNQVKSAIDLATDENGVTILSLYGEQIDDVIAKLNEASISAHDFNQALSGDTSKLGWDLSGYADVIKESGLDDIDLLNMIKDGGIEDVKAYFASASVAAKEELAKLQEGGSVDLTLRPTIDTSLLLDAGWSEAAAGAAGEIATVFSSTFSNITGDVAINFTPIMADESGNLRSELSPEAFSEYVKNVTSGVHGDFLNLQVGVGLEFVNEHGGVLSEEALTTYAENVLAGVHDDYLKLQIGAAFTGESAIDEAEVAAERIHNLHDGLFADGFKNQETALIKIMEAAKELGIIEGFTADQMDELTNALSNAGVLAKQIAEDTGAATKSYADMATSVSSLKSELGAINGAISEQGYSGNLSVDTYDSLIAISKDYAACVEYQNGALQLNAEKANMLFEAKSELMKADLELQKLTEAAKWKENADEIARLTKQYDGLDSAISDKIKSLEKENDGIEANLVGYDLQIAAIEELTSAYGRWKAASESDNSDSMYKDIQNAYKAIKEAQKTGQTGVGNVVYQAAVELLVPDGEDVKKYMGTLKRYITDGSSGLTNFINDMVSKGLMERSKTDWNEVSMVAGTTMQEIMDKMTLTPDMAKAIFNALEMYDFDFHWTDEDFNISTSSVEEMQEELKRLQAEADATRAKIAELNEAGVSVDVATGMSLEAYQKKHEEQIAAYNKIADSLGVNSYDQTANKIEYTVAANTEEADAALDAIKKKLEDILSKIESISEKKLGDLGGGATKSILDRVHSRLIDIANFKIADKTFNIIPKLSNTTSANSSGQTSGALVPGNNIFGSLLPQDIGFFASGTKYAPDGPAILGDEYSPDGSPKPELVISDGSAYVAGQSGPELVSLNRGDQVIPADETRRILHGNPQVRNNTIPAFASGTGWLGNIVSKVSNAIMSIGNAITGKPKDTGKINTSASSSNSSSSSTKSSSATNSSKTSVSMALAPTYRTYDTDKYKEYDEAVENIKNSTKSTGVKISDGGNQSSLNKNYSGAGSGSGGSSSSSSDSSGSSKKEKSRFEKDYELKNHYLNMEKMDYEEYIDWLEDAYKEAYEKGEIELEDYYKYAEEVFNGQKELFQDSIEDIEHKIKGLEREPGNEQQIVNYYNQIIQKIDAEIADARVRGLNDDDDYIQELLEQKWGYADEIKDIQDEITENAKDAVEDLIDYRMDMLKQDLENERDAIGDKLDTLRDFYDKQKEMLQDVYDEEKYLEEQSEKRKSVDDIKAEIDMLRFDDSAKAQKRIKELQEELKDAEKELSDFEKDHALESATDLLDKMYEQQESQMQSEMDALEERLNDPNALYNQALRDIQNNTLALYEEMIKYNNKYGSGNPDDIFNMWYEADKSLDAYFKAMGESYKNILLVDAYKPTGYASGTSHATPGIHELFEGNKDEYVYTTKDGKRYRMFSGLGDKVLNASATDFLYKFANNGETFISNMLNGLVSAIGNVGKPTQQIQLSTGDIVVQGNATADTVSAIRRAQRENIDFVLREFTRLNR